MNRMQKNLILLGLISISLIACKKEPTTWNTDWSAPIAYGHLTLDDFVPEENLETNTDGYLSLVYHESVYSFSLDTLLKIPDTTIVNTYNIGVPSFSFNPGALLPTVLDQTYDMGQMELTRVMVKSGTGTIKMQSTWPGMTHIDFNFPQVYDNSGANFARTYLLPAGSISNPSEEIELVDMAGFDMYLTGSDGSSVNTLYADFNMGSGETTDVITVSNSDTIYYIIGFEDVIPSYAKGYFGQYYLSDTIGLSLDPMKSVIAGSIDVDSIDLTLTVKNGFKLIAQTKITKVTGINSRTNNNVDLNFPLLNSTININQASGGFYGYTPSEYPIQMDNNNSNMTSFIENLPDSVDLGYELEINPFGNSSGGNDEFFPGSEMELFLDAEFPLEFSANELTIVDTLDIDYTAPTSTIPTDGTIILSYNNAFPLGATATFYMLDESGVVIDSIMSTSSILPGSYDSGTYITNPYMGNVNYELSEENVRNLDDADKIVLKVAFTTDQTQMIKIDANSFFDFNLRTNLQIQISL